MAERFELVVSPIQEMPEITFNFEELKELLENRLDTYNKHVVTEDGVKQAKEDRAKLNKLRDSIKAERISRKKEFLEPFEDFERKCKILEAMVANASEAIDNQVRGFEERERAEKRKEIVKVYLDEIGEYDQLVPLEKIFDSKWLNKTFKMKDIENFIKATKMTAENGVAKIKALNSEFEDQMLSKFFENLNINDAYAEKTILEQRKKDLEELEAKRKAELLAEDVPMTQEDIALMVEEEFVKEEESHQEVAALGEIKAEEPELITMVFKVVCTRDQLASLGEYMRKTGIRYGRP